MQGEPYGATSARDANDPDREYANDGWIDWYAFLGTPPPVRAADKLTYEKCAAEARRLGLRSQSKYHAWCKANPMERLALGMPRNPDREYAKDGWVDWYAFLDTPPPVGSADKLTYEKCEAEARRLGLRSKPKYRAWCKANPEKRREFRMPTNPDREYTNDGWVGWHEFLDTPPPVRAADKC